MDRSTHGERGHERRHADAAAAAKSKEEHPHYAAVQTSSVPLPLVPPMNLLLSKPAVDACTATHTRGLRLEANRLGDQGVSFSEIVSSEKRKLSACAAHTRRGREGGGARKTSNGTDVVALSNASYILPVRCSSSAVTREGEREGRGKEPSPLNFSFFLCSNTAIEQQQHPSALPTCSASALGQERP